MKRLKKSIPTLAVLILISLCVNWLSNWLQSDFIANFFEEDLLTILIALLAINLTTIGVIMAKMQDMAGQGKLDYSGVITEMKMSIREQVGLVATTFLLLIFNESRLIAAIWEDFDNLNQFFLIFMFLWAIWILYSTGEGIFIIARIENQRMLEKHKDNDDSQ